MATLLKIDVSPRGDWSVTRNLGDSFETEWLAAHPGGKVIVRDLATSNVPFLDLSWIIGAYSPAESHTPEQKKALAISDEFIAELHEADHYLITTPMFNFSIPAVLKAWIDHAVRTGKTFTMNEDGTFTGLLDGKIATVIIASAGIYSPSSSAKYAIQASDASNFERPYLKHILGFIGVQDVEFVEAEATFKIMTGAAAIDDMVGPLLPAVTVAAKRQIAAFPIAALNGQNDAR
jgi:FMN-dependent NADH-azoreductase